LTDTLVNIFDLNKTFYIKEGPFHKKSALRALTDINLEIRKGETLGLVGESGCGKSTLGRCILRLIRPDSGSVLYNGEDILTLDDEVLRQKRKEMQIIFQDPVSSLNPYMKVESIIGEGYKIHGIHTDKKVIADNVKELMKKCGLKEEMMHRKPHEFSGGQRQRISIARALAVNPEFIVCDEPVSALDVSVQAQIINLLIDLQKEFDLTYLFISHDLKLVEQISDRIAVMYLGRIVEKKSADDIKTEPIHPYTRLLLSSILETGADTSNKTISEGTGLGGDIPSPIDMPSGCVFNTRCAMKKDICAKEVPELKEIGKGHHAACHFM
jgi:oligopeptide/dipeptide ABC transporter ATP-binding protein